MTRDRVKRLGFIAGGVLLLLAAVGAGVVYSWTFTPHGRLDLLFAVGLRLAGPLPGTVSVEEERAALREILRQWPGGPKPLPRVEDRAIPGPAGEIPIRIYWPSVGDQQPILVFYHGGGFRLGDVDTYDSICRELADRAGVIVVSVGYRLAPEAVYPAAVDDSYAALEWVHAHAADISGDASRIAVGGDSAGGNLAAVVSLKARDRGGPPVVFQLLVYPVLNLVDMETGSHKLFAEGYLIGGAAAEFTRDAYLPNPADRRSLYASPLLADDLEDLRPALVITAGFDPLRDEGEAYAQKLADAGVQARASRYEGVPHAFLIRPGRHEPQVGRSPGRGCGRPSWSVQLRIQMPLSAGTTLGSYSVTAKIGEGGMGEVYRARDTKLDRDVALKVLPEAFTSDPDRLARLEREAKVLASLNHPNIGHICGLEEAVHVDGCISAVCSSQYGNPGQSRA